MEGFSVVALAVFLEGLVNQATITDVVGGTMTRQMAEVGLLQDTWTRVFVLPVKRLLKRVNWLPDLPLLSIRPFVADDGDDTADSGAGNELLYLPEHFL